MTDDAVTHERPLGAVPMLKHWKSISGFIIMRWSIVRHWPECVPLMPFRSG